MVSMRSSVVAYISFQTTSARQLQICMHVVGKERGACLPPRRCYFFSKVAASICQYLYVLNRLAKFLGLCRSVSARPIALQLPVR